MKIEKITREYGRTVFLSKDGRQQGSISAKVMLEAAIADQNEFDSASQALQTLANVEVEKVLKAKLTELGY